MLLLGGAFAVSLVALPIEPAPPAVVAEPEAPTAQRPPVPSVLRGPTSAAPSPEPEPSPSPGPLSVTGSSPQAPPSLAPPAPSPPPTLAPVAPSATARDVPRGPHPSAGPSSQAAMRSDGAWARDIAKLALAGDRAAAAAELAAFRKAYPNSTYITRLESMVASGSKPAPGNAAAPTPAGAPSPSSAAPGPATAPAPEAPPGE